MGLTLAQCFGDSATQNISTLVIHKTELPGLNAVSSNTAESLVVGILLKILENFEGKLTTETGETITNETGVAITFNQGDIADLFYLQYWRVIFRTKTLDYRIFQLVLHVFEGY